MIISNNLNIRVTKHCFAAASECLYTPTLSNNVKAVYSEAVLDKEYGAFPELVVTVLMKTASFLNIDSLNVFFYIFTFKLDRVESNALPKTTTVSSRKRKFKSQMCILCYDIFVSLPLSPHHYRSRRTAWHSHLKLILAMSKVIAEATASGMEGGSIFSKLLLPTGNAVCSKEKESRLYGNHLEGVKMHSSFSVTKVN